MQLTIDYDLQTGGGSRVQRHAGFNGAALIMDPRNGEVLTYTSLPSYDPNDFAAGIDRVTWASLNTDKLRPAAEPRDSGALLARIDVQDRGRDGRRSRKDSSTPDFRVQLQRRGELLRPLYQVLPQRRPRVGRHASRD